MKQTNRQRAKSEGLVHYYSDKPCKNGHYGPKLVSNRKCLACDAIRQKIYVACKCEGCSRNAHYTAKGARGFCASHLLMMNTRGNTDPICAPNGTRLKWLIDHSSYKSDECLIFPFTNGRGAYPRATDWNGVVQNAHRIMCRLVNGEPPNDAPYDSAHSCGRGREGCVNPNHLSWKTRKENAHDMVAHGTKLYGEKSPRAKITETQAREIISLYGRMTAQEIADRYGLVKGTVYEIHAGRIWKHLGGVIGSKR